MMVAELIRKQCYALKEEIPEQGDAQRTLRDCVSQEFR
jgi:hypothetical protein